MAFFDDLRDRWERLAPRERRLVQALGLTFVLCIFGFVGFLINDGLNEIEARNAEARDALHIIARNRDTYEQSRTANPLTAIPDQAQPLATYVDQIAQETGITIPEENERPAQQKGRFTERSIDMKLRGVSLQQLTDFLQKVETRSPAVVTQRIFVKTYFNQHEKLDVELTIATYERGSAKEGGAKGRTGGRDGGAGGGEGSAG